MPFATSKTASPKERAQSLAPVSMLLAACILLAGCAMTRSADLPMATAPAADSDLLVVTSKPGTDANPGAGQAADPRPTPSAADSVTAAPEAADQQTAITQTHTIKAGDTLTRIAERYGVSIKSLLLANDLPNPDYLTVGQVINLPPTPIDYTPPIRILPESRLVRSAGAFRFDVAAFVDGQPGALRRMTQMTPTRLADGTQRTDQLTGSQIIDRVSREYSVDARVLLAFLERYAGLVSDPSVDEEAQLYPLLPPDPASGRMRGGIYNQLSWLADRLNQGYYGWKYRGENILELAAGDRLYYHPALEAGSVAVQYAAAQLVDGAEWEADVGEDGLKATYRRLFGDPFEGARATLPDELRQPVLTLPFPKGETWRFTGGFHGGWGNGSAWSAIDFAPPDNAEGGWCYTSKHPTTAVARGLIARLGDGVIVLDLDEDGDEGSGWTILYLHLSPHDALREGQVVEAGNILGYVSCAGGFSTATHLHIARRYNGEWLPADCNRCPAGRAAPPFVMSDWKVVGLASQLYQGFLVNTRDNRNVIAEQGRYTDVNAISW